MADVPGLYSGDFAETALTLTTILAIMACLSLLTWVVFRKGLPWLHRRGQKRSSASDADRGGDNIPRGEPQSEGVASRARSPQSSPLSLFGRDQYDQDAVNLDKVVVDSLDGLQEDSPPAVLYYDRIPMDRLKVYSTSGHAADDESGAAGCRNSPAPGCPSSNHCSRRHTRREESQAGTVGMADGVSDRRRLEEASSAALEPHRRREPPWPLGADASLAGRPLTYFRNLTGGRPPGACSSDESAGLVLMPSSTESEDERNGSEHDGPATGLAKEHPEPAAFQPRAWVATGRADVERQSTWSSGALRERWGTVPDVRARRSL